MSEFEKVNNKIELRDEPVHYEIGEIPSSVLRWSYCIIIAVLIIIVLIIYLLSFLNDTSYSLNQMNMNLNN